MDELPLFPLGSVLFPGVTLPLQIFEPRYRELLRRCMDREEPFGVVLIRSGVEVGGSAEPFDIGTTARIVRVQPMQDERFAVLAIGERRFQIMRTMNDYAYLTGEVVWLADTDTDAAAVPALAEKVGELFSDYTKLGLALTDQWTAHVGLPKRPGTLADRVAAQVDVDMRVKQRFLEELSVPRRLEMAERLLDVALTQLRARLVIIRRQKLTAFGLLN